jgi:ABC-type nitrate/sulfonate/bicarbonate transport system substrate-binding protein
MKLIQLIVLLATLFVSQFFAHAQELRRIMYGTTASPSHLPIWVAKDAGLFEKAGMNVEPVQIRGGSLITLAIITGATTVLGRERSQLRLPAQRVATGSFCLSVNQTVT